MPIYAYKCDACGLTKDVLQKMSDAPLTDCPACGQASFKKQLTAAGFQLKGSGWYVTDFRGGNAASSGSGTAASDGAGGGGAETKSDAKPAESSPSTAKSESAPAASAGGCGSSCACH